ncbi:hypothetical protein GCM10027030_26740 [Luteococcus sediminum]
MPSTPPHGPSTPPATTRGLTNLSPAEQLRAGRMGRRIVQLMVGLWLFGSSTAILLRSGLGLAPWDVLHQGISRHVPLSIGTVAIVTGAVVLLLWIPLREWPGLGTVLNIVVIELAMDATLAMLPRHLTLHRPAGRCCWQASPSMPWAGLSTSAPSLARGRATA